MFHIYSNFCNQGEFVRITGYLMRRSDYLKFAKEGSRYHSDIFGAGAINNRHLLTRPTRSLSSNPLQGKFRSFYHISLVDGPGSRSALYFQGCNLRCTTQNVKFFVVKF